MFQRNRFVLAVLASLVALAPMSAQALTPYSQDFELLVKSDPAALANDGWVVFGNVFDPVGNYLYGYGVFPAPNDGFGFCTIDELQGGPDQGLQQLSVFSDYNNGDHANGNIIQSNVFQEQTITAADVGKTFTVAFDAKMGNLVAPSTAQAFIKTIDPANNFNMTNNVTADMTTTPVTWQGYTLSLFIDAGLVGQLLQFGFLNEATFYESSGVFYDNVNFYEDTASPVPDVIAMQGAELRQNYPNPFNPSTRIDFRLEEAGQVQLAVYDVAGRLVATLENGSLGAGNHHVEWNGRSDAGLPAAAGRYSYVLRTAEGTISRSMMLVK